MKIYEADYYAMRGYGAYDEVYLVVIANTEKEALGMALEQVENSKAKDWELKEIPFCAGATLITSWSR